MCRCPTRGDTLRAAGPPTGRMRKFSTRYGMNTTPSANGPGSGGSTISLGGGSLSMGTTVLWAKAPVANTVQAATAASVLMSRFIAVSPFGDSLRRYRQAEDDAHVRRAIPAQHFTSATS